VSDQVNWLTTNVPQGIFEITDGSKGIFNVYTNGNVNLGVPTSTVSVSGTLVVYGPSTLATTTITSSTIRTINFTSATGTNFNLAGLFNFQNATGTSITSTNAAFTSSIKLTAIASCNASNQALQTGSDGSVSCGTLATGGGGGGNVGTSTIGYFSFYNTATSVTGTQYMAISGDKIVFTTGTTFTTSTITYLNVQNITSTLATTLNLSVTGTSTLATTTFNKYVGIGTTSPQAGLHLYGNQLLVDNPVNASIVTSSAAAGSVRGVFVSGRYAYVAASGTGFAIFDISNPSYPKFISSDNATQASDVVVSGRYAYIAGGVDGMTIYDIYAPAGPQRITTILGGGSIDNIKLRGRYLYAADSVNGQIYIIDVSNPGNPAVVGSIASAGAFGIAVDGDFLYSVNVRNSSDVFDVFYVRDPSNPQYVTTYNDGNVVGNGGIAVSGAYAYAALSNGTVDVLDVTIPGAPLKVATISGFNDPNYLTVAGNYLYVGDFNGGTLKIIDISSSTAPRVIKSISVGNVWGATVSGHYVYSGTAKGLTIVDIGGAEVDGANIGSINAGNLTVWGGADVGELNVKNGLNLGYGGLYSQGGVSIYGNTLTVQDFAGTTTLSTSSLVIGGSPENGYNPTIISNNGFVTDFKGTRDYIQLEGSVNSVGTLGVGNVFAGDAGYTFYVNGNSKFVGTTTLATTTISSSTIRTLNFTSATGTNLNLSGVFNFVNATGTSITSTNAAFTSSIKLTSIASCNASNQALQTGADGSVSCGTLATGGGGGGNVGTSTIGYFAFYNTATSVTGTQYMAISGDKIVFTTGTTFTSSTITYLNFQNATGTNMVLSGTLRVSQTSTFTTGTFSSSVGIGTTTPYTSLVVVGAKPNSGQSNTLDLGSEIFSVYNGTNKLMSVGMNSSPVPLLDLSTGRLTTMQIDGSSGGNADLILESGSSGGSVFIQGSGVSLMTLARSGVTVANIPFIVNGTSTLATTTISTSTIAYLNFGSATGTSLVLSRSLINTGTSTFATTTISSSTISKLNATTITSTKITATNVSSTNLSVNGKTELTITSSGRFLDATYDPYVQFSIWADSGGVTLNTQNLGAGVPGDLLIANQTGIHSAFRENGNFDFNPGNDAGLGITLNGFLRVSGTSTLQSVTSTNLYVSGLTNLPTLNFTSATGTNLRLGGLFNFMNATGTSITSTNAAFQSSLKLTWITSCNASNQALQTGADGSVSCGTLATGGGGGAGGVNTSTAGYFAFYLSGTGVTGTSYMTISGDKIAFTTNTSFTTSTFSKRVGIGTTAPSSALHIYDGLLTIDSPKTPQLRGTVDLSGGRNPWQVLVSGKYAYTLNGGDNSISVIDISDPNNPREVAVTRDNDKLSGIGSGFISGNYLYVGSYGPNLFTVVDITDPASPTTTGYIIDSQRMNSPTSMFVSGKYAYVTTNFGLSVVDVSNPKKPEIISFLDVTGAGGSGGVYVRGKYAYVGTGYNNGFAIVDISDPYTPFTAGLVNDSRLAGPVSVYVSGMHAYVANSGNNSVAVIDISSSTNPVITGFASSSQLSSANQITVSGKYAYVPGIGAGGLLNIIDISSSTRPTTTATVGGFSQPPSDIKVVGHYAYVVDAVNLYIYDLGGADIFAANIGNLATNQLTVFEKADVEGLEIRSGMSVGKGGITSNGGITVSNGLLDVNSPNSPKMVAWQYLDTSGNTADVYVAGKFAYYTSQNNNGIYIQDISDPKNPKVVGSTFHATKLRNATKLFVMGRYAYVTLGNPGDGLAVVDVSNPTVPTTTGYITNAALGGASGIYVSGKYAYIAATGNNGIAVVDISNPSAPRVVSSLSDGVHYGGVNTIYVAGKYAYTNDDWNHALAVTDISDPYNPTLVGYTSHTKYFGGVYEIKVSGRYAYLSNFDLNGLTIVDISSSTAPTTTGFTSSTHMQMASGVKISGKYAYVTKYESDPVTGFGGVAVVDISSSTAPTTTGFLQNNNLGQPWAMAISGHYGFVANFTGIGVGVVDLLGADISNASIGSLMLTDLTVGSNGAINNDLYVGSGLTVGSGGILTNGGLTVFGTTTLATTTISNLIVTNCTGCGGAVGPNLFVQNVSTTNLFASGTISLATSTMGSSTVVFLNFGSATGTNLNLTKLISTTSTLTYINTQNVTSTGWAQFNALVGTTSTLTYLNFASATGTLLNVNGANITTGTYTYINAGNVTSSGRIQFNSMVGTTSTITYLNFGNATGTSVVANSGIITTSTITYLNFQNATGTSLTFTVASGTSITSTYIYSGSNLTVSGTFKDYFGRTGTQGQVLVVTSTGGVQWMSTTSLGLASGGGSFLQLTDTPNSYTGQAGLCLKVNPGETGVEFGLCASGGGGGGVNTSTTGYFAYYQNAYSVTGTSQLQFQNGSLIFATTTSFTTTSILTRLQVGTTSNKGDLATFNGNVLLTAQPDATSSMALISSSTAGWFGSDMASGTSASVIYNGKLFVATKENNLAAVYRYEGGTQWTRVTNAAGKVLSADPVNVDAFSMTAFNGKLYIGTQTGAGAGVANLYVSSDADTSAGEATWVAVNATPGAFISGNTAQDGIGDMAVYNGALYFVTQKANAADVVMYLGGTAQVASLGFMRINNSLGKFITGDTADIDDMKLAVFGGRLIIGAQTGVSFPQMRIGYYDGVPGTGITKMNSTNGQLTTADQATIFRYSNVTAIGVYNGALFVAINSSTLANSAVVYRYTGGFQGVAGTTGWVKVSNSPGKINATDAWDTNSVSFMKTYNGRFYMGTFTNAPTGTASFYEYNNSNVSTSQWVAINPTRGTIGSEANVDEVNSLIDFNGVAYIGTFDNNTGNGGVYAWSKTLDNSYGLRFDGGGSVGKISFVGSQQANDASGRSGTFLFTHSVSLGAAAFDYAEDYPTLDETLEAGEVVQIDTSTSQFIRRADTRKNFIGIISEKPGFRLSRNMDEADARYIPVALSGRVPVKVSTENGPIMSGDFLTISAAQPGVAVKATTPGQVVAQALENYSGESVGKVMAFVNVSYFDGKNEEGGLVYDTIIPVVSTTAPVYDAEFVSKYISDFNTTSPENLSAFNLEAGTSITGPKVATKTLNVETIQPLSGTINFNLSTSSQFVVTSLMGGTSTEVVTIDKDGNAFFAGEIKAGKIDVQNIEGLKEMKSTIDSLVERVMNLEAELAKATSTLYQNQEQLKTLFATTTTSTVEMASTTLQLASTSTTSGMTFDNLVAFGGGVKVDEISSFSSSTLSFLNDTLFLGRPYFTEDTAGFAVIRAGETSTTITFAREYLEQPVVSASISLEGNTTTENVEVETIFASNTQFVVSSKSVKGFKIRLNAPAPVDIRFSWIALAVRGARTFVSEIPLQTLVDTSVMSTTTEIMPTVTTTEIIESSTTTVAASSTAADVPSSGNTDTLAQNSSLPDAATSSTPVDAAPSGEAPAVTIIPAPVVDPMLSTTTTP
jgi:hypothetical protein